MRIIKPQTNLSESKPLSTLKKPINNWRSQLKQTQLVSQASIIILQRRTNFWAPLLKSLNFSSNFTPSLFRLIFDRIENNPKICLNFVKWAKRNLDFTPDLKTQCRLTAALFGSGLPKLGKPILYSLIQDYPPAKIVPLLVQSRKRADIFTISPLLNSAIECFCDEEMHRQSLQVYQIATMQGVGLNVDACNALLDLLSEKNELRIAWEFYASMIRNGVTGNQFTWFLAAKLLCKDGKSERLSKILDLGIQTPLIFDLAVEFCCKRQDFESGFDHVSRMCANRIEPTFSTYSSILDEACRHRNIKLPETVMCLMLKKGYFPEPMNAHYDLIIQKLCDSRKSYAAKFFFKKASDEKIELQHSTYECMLEASLSEEGGVEDAIELYQLMQLKGISISQNCCTKFVSILCKENPSHDVSQLLSDVVRRGQPGSVSLELSNYISKVCSIGEWREAEELLNSSLDRGHLIDPAICGLFVKFYCSIRKLGSATWLHDKLIGLKGSLDVAAYDVLLTALLKDKRVDAAMAVFDYMKACQTLSSESFTVVITGLCREKELRKAMRLHDEMLELKLKPDLKTYKRLISCFR